MAVTPKSYLINRTSRLLIFFLALASLSQLPRFRTCEFHCDWDEAESFLVAVYRQQYQ